MSASGQLGGTLAWLLEPSNPSARYLTLTKILGQSNEAADVSACRETIPQAGPALDILLAQYPQGYWMHPGIGYSPRYRATVWQILILAQLGMPRCEALDRAVGHLFEANQREDGAFRAGKEADETPLGLNGSLLWALETLGYGDEPQVEAAWSWLLRDVEAHGLARARRRSTPCLWAAVGVLRAIDATPPHRRDEGVRRLRRAAAAFLLDRPPCRTQSDSSLFQLTFPLTRVADLLEWMEVLAGAGYGTDPRLAPARAWLARKRRADGTWPLERVPGKLWADFGELGRPNKWITIRALAASSDHRQLDERAQ